MSIADAVRARELEARVAELERRMALVEQFKTKSEPSATGRAFVENISRRPPVKADDAA